MSDGRQVTVGGEIRTIAKFRSYKAVIALEILSGVTGRVRELLRKVEAERQRYAEDNKVTITRQKCIERAADLKAAAQSVRTRAAVLDSEEAEAPERRSTTLTDTESEDRATAEDFRAQADDLDQRAARWERQLADMGDRQYVEFPGELPPDEETLIAVSEAMQMREQFIQLLGLALIPDSELKSAWRTDEVGKTLLARGEDLLEELELGEEIELAIAVKEVIDDQLRPRKQALAKLRALYGRQKTTKDDKPSSENPGTEPTTPTSDSPASSTPSPPDTDGDPSESSSGSPTESTSPSPVA